MKVYFLTGHHNPFERRNVRIAVLTPSDAEPIEGYGAAIVEALGNEYPVLLAMPTRANAELRSVRAFHREYCVQTTILGVRSSLARAAPIGPSVVHVHSIITVKASEAPVRMRQLWNAGVQPKPGLLSGLTFAGLLGYIEGLLESLDNQFLSPFSTDTRRHGFTAAFLCTDKVATPRKEG